MDRRELGDGELLALLSHDPAMGLERAISAYGGGVRTICANVLGRESRQDIEECVSDVFVALWRAAPSFQSERGSLKSYVYGIARHLAVDRYRRESRGGIPVPMDESELELSVEVDFSDVVARKQNSQILKETIDGLPSPDREIFIYRYCFYEKIKEIAERLSLPPKTVENKLYRGKKALQSQLLERGIIL